MEHTEYYHLPQWEETDRIMMDDFNDAFSKLDTAVKANSTAIASKADTSALAAETAARQAGDLWVKLGTYTLAANALTLNIPIADAEDYAELRLYSSVTVGGTGYQRYSFGFNNAAVTFGYVDFEHTMESTTTGTPALLPDAIHGAGGIARIFPMGTGAIGIALSDMIGLGAQRTETTAVNDRYCTSDLSFSTLQSMQITGNRTGGTGTFTLYGLKK